MVAPELRSDGAKCGADQRNRRQPRKLTVPHGRRSPRARQKVVPQGQLRLEELVEIEGYLLELAAPQVVLHHPHSPHRDSRNSAYQSKSPAPKATF